jgi:release factor glutamine methyltransferase
MIEMKNMSAIEISKIDRWQKERQKAFKSIPAAGKTIRYLGKIFLVYPNTFWPFKDSQPLVQNFQIKDGESVLDVGTGSGVIAVFACYRGAARVVAVDINPSAIKSAKYNAKLHGFDKSIEIRRSNLFDRIKPEKFDVITANLPFRNKPAHDLVAQSQWDTDFKTNKRFFEEVGRYLKPNGRVYFAQSNFGAIKEMKILAKAAGFSIKVMGSETEEKTETKKFYAFVLKRKSAEI